MTIYKEKRYVVVEPNSGKYCTLNAYGEYVFVDKISQASKSVNKTTAKMFKRLFKRNNGLDDIELLIVPTVISYEIPNQEDWSDSIGQITEASST